MWVRFRHRLGVGVPTTVAPQQCFCCGSSVGTRDHAMVHKSTAEMTQACCDKLPQLAAAKAVWGDVPCDQEFHSWLPATPRWIVLLTIRTFHAT
jgi:hypothetical protein